MRVSDGVLPPVGALDPNVHVEMPKNPTFKQRRRMFRQLRYGFIKGISPICCDSNDPATQVAGIQKRMGRMMPTADPESLASFSNYVDWWLKKHLTPLAKLDTFEEWLEGTNYTEERKNELRNENAINHWQADNRKFRRVASFQKSESYPMYKHARGINSRHDAFKCFSGPAFKSIERQVYNVRHNGKLIFVKHIPVQDRPAAVAALWQDGSQTRESDFSNYEASFFVAMMLICELKLYAYMLQRFPTISKAVCDTIGGVNHGSMRCGVKFSLRGRRMSGDMCTSLGNGFTNFMVFSWLMRGRKWDGMVEGDDGVFCVHDRLPLPTEADYAKLGFVVKLVEHEKPSEANFCGIVCADQAVLKNPIKVFQTFGWTQSQIYSPMWVMDELLRAKALSLAYEAPHCPLTRALADRALYETRGCKPRFVSDGYHDFSDVPTDESKLPSQLTDGATRVLFARLYGVSPDDQIVIENRIRAGDDLSFMHSVLHFSDDTKNAYSRYVIAA